MDGLKDALKKHGIYLSDEGLASCIEAAGGKELEKIKQQVLDVSFIMQMPANCTWSHWTHLLFGFAVPHKIE